MTGALVHIVDDDLELGEGLDRLLRSVGIATRCHPSVQAFVESDRPDLPSCLLLDVRLPGMSGLEFQAKLDSYGLRLPVIVMTGFGDIQMSVRAMKAGAIDFLLKPFREQDLLDAVSTALERDRERRAQEAGLAALRARYETLSSREQEVMKHVVTGLMNKQVAAELRLSEVTVKTHRSSLMRKMGVRTLADLVRASEALNP